MKEGKIKLKTFSFGKTTPNKTEIGVSHSSRTRVLLTHQG